MKKKLIAGLLALLLCLTPALAVTDDLFPGSASYPGFADVPDGQWYTDAVRTCCEVGLMQGKDGGVFDPNGTLSVAEVVTIAARMLERISGEAIPFPTPLPGETLPWYTAYTEYLTRNSVVYPEDVGRKATRQEFFALLAAVVPSAELPAINSITALPDNGSASVLAFYNAGILTGVDEYGTFNGQGTLSRAECAAMVARIVRTDLRKKFTLKERTMEEELQDTMALMVNGHTITLPQFVGWLNQVVFLTDYNLYQNYRTRLDWDVDYGVGDLEEYFINVAIQRVTNYIIAQELAASYGCEVADLPAAMNPAPSRDTLSAYAQSMDYLSAKHILVSDAATAQAILDGLSAIPTMDQFNALLEIFGEDPGMKSNPDGYLFTAGEMVSEFEAGTRALQIGAYSEVPVQTTYGYHIIWRLDPVDHPDLLSDYQERIYSTTIDALSSKATLTVNEVMLGQLDVRACYERYLESMAS